MRACAYCGRETDAGICDECWEPIAQYLEAGGTPKEYFRAVMKALAEEAVRELVRTSMRSPLAALNRKEDTPSCDHKPLDWTESGTWKCSRCGVEFTEGMEEIQKEDKP